MMTIRRTKGDSRSPEVARLYLERIDRQEERCFRIADEYVLAIEAAGFEVEAVSARMIEVKSSGRKVGYLEFRERLSRRNVPGAPRSLQRTPNVMIDRLIRRSEPKDDLIAAIPKGIADVKMTHGVSQLLKERRLEVYAAAQAERLLESKREVTQDRISSTIKAFTQMAGQLEAVRRARDLLVELERAASEADALTIELLQRFVRSSDPLRDGADVALRTLTILLQGKPDT